MDSYSHTRTHTHSMNNNDMQMRVNNNAMQMNANKNDMQMRKTEVILIHREIAVTVGSEVSIICLRVGKEETGRRMEERKKTV